MLGIKEINVKDYIDKKYDDIYTSFKNNVCQIEAFEVGKNVIKVYTDYKKCNPRIKIHDNGLHRDSARSFDDIIDVFAWNICLEAEIICNNITKIIKNEELNYGFNLNKILDISCEYILLHEIVHLWQYEYIKEFCLKLKRYPEIRKSCEYIADYITWKIMLRKYSNDNQYIDINLIVFSFIIMHYYGGNIDGFIKNISYFKLIISGNIDRCIRSFFKKEIKFITFNTNLLNELNQYSTYLETKFTLDNLVAISVLNYNNYLDTIECLDSLYDMVYDNYLIILVDNNSTDGSQKAFDKYKLNHRELVYIISKKNGGYAAGNNLAIKYAMEKTSAKYVWILNNDTIVDKFALKKLVSKCDNDSNIGACGSKLMYHWDKKKIQGYGGKYSYWLGRDSCIKDSSKIKEMDYVIGASMLVPMHVFKEKGLLNEEYFLYYEELDWKEKIGDKYKIDCADKSIVYHKEGGSIGSNACNPKEKSLLADYFLVRNRIIFTYKYYKQYIPTVYLGIIIMILKRINRGQWNRALMFLKLMLGIRCDKFENMIER